MAAPRLRRLGFDIPEADQATSRQPPAARIAWDTVESHIDPMDSPVGAAPRPGVPVRSPTEVRIYAELVAAGYEAAWNRGMRSGASAMPLSGTRTATPSTCSLPSASPPAASLSRAGHRGASS